LVPSLYFNRKSETISETVFGGSILYQESLGGGVEPTKIMDEMLQGMLPNPDITDTKRLTGLFTDAFLLKVDQTQPAASRDTTVTHWTYVILVDKKKTTATNLVGYELFFKSDFASEADAVKVAESFRLI
jgi:hypothetical protein